MQISNRTRISERCGGEVAIARCSYSLHQNFKTLKLQGTHRNHLHADTTFVQWMYGKDMINWAAKSAIWCQVKAKVDKWAWLTGRPDLG